MSTQTATRPNTYAGDCSSCGTRVAASGGLLGPKVGGRWTVQHTTCPTATAQTRTASSARRPASHRCESCGGGYAHWATDMSGIGGYACRTCDDGYLSLA